jgi:myo-inositol-1(or 4)-monophosphatase
MASEYVTFAANIAQEAGELLKRELPNEHRIEFKGAINIVTEVDRMAEELLMARIRKHFPHHDILTEESAGFECGSAYRWIIDPLDGTTNYAHGYPVFCVSVALEIAGEISCGAIYNPMAEEMFTAEKQGGAFLNGRMLLVSKTDELCHSLLATGFPYDLRESEDNNIDYFIGMAYQAQAIRRAGSAALDLAYVAAGRFDGFWELKLKPWDTAAGWLMIKEAGGEVSDLYGHAYSLTSPHIVAANKMIHGKMIAALSSCVQLREGI